MLSKSGYLQRNGLRTLLRAYDFIASSVGLLEGLLSEGFLSEEVEFLVLLFSEEVL